MHEPPSRQGQWLGQVVQGWFNYHAVPTNIRVLSAFRFNVVDLWQRSLRRRSQKDVTTWERIESLAREWLPPPKILHPWPSGPLPRQTPEVGAVCGNPARTDLSGGRSAMDVPTAIEPLISVDF